jgi:triacylglycerol lipase
MLIAMTNARAAGERETVVLLHGIGRTRWSMAALDFALRRDGYRVVNLSYPWRTVSLDRLATEWLPQRLRRAGITDGPASANRLTDTGDVPPALHIVTHSMGGLVVRAWVNRCGAPANLQSVVMLAPPNAGSEAADRLNRFPPYRWLLGANGAQLGTSSKLLPATLGPWPAGPTAPALGIIAGDRPLNPWMASLLPTPNDGKVSVAATHLAGESGHLIVHHSHTWIGWRKDTIAEIAGFLRTGQFSTTRT